MLLELIKAKENQGKPYEKLAHIYSAKTISAGNINNLRISFLKNFINEITNPKYNEQ